jgi:hypothetical protein
MVRAFKHRSYPRTEFLTAARTTEVGDPTWLVLAKNVKADFSLAMRAAKAF